MAAAVVMTVTLAAPSAAAVARDEAIVVRAANDPYGPGRRLAAGGATAPFSLQLPKGAACKGSSADAGYRVQSFMVPSSVDPSTLTFDSTGPTPRHPLYTVAGDPYVDAQTAKGEKNDPGFIVNIPAFSLTVFGPDDLPAGPYAVGLACTRDYSIDRLWTTTINVQQDRSWRVADATEAEVRAALAPTPTTASITTERATEASSSDRKTEAEVIAVRNALPAEPGGNPSVNGSFFEVPRGLLFLLVLVALRVAFLFRPRTLVMES